MGEIIVPKIKDITVRQEGDRVLIIADKQVVLDIPWEIAPKLGKALYVQGKKAEEYAKKEIIIADQAVLLRAGFPIGLTGNKDIMDEAKKEAVSNKKLRRYMPGGVKSQEAFGTPAIIKERRQ